MVKRSDINKQIIKDGWGEILARPTPYMHVPTGILTYDMAHLGGPALGFIHQTIGYYSSGKTTLSFMKAASFQRAFPDKCVVFLDLEGTFNEGWAQVFGVDTSKERFEYLRPVTGEQAVDLVFAFMQADDVSLVIFDSIPQIAPEEAFERDAEAAKPRAEQAKLVSQMMSKAVKAINDAKNKGTHIPTLDVLNYWRAQASGFGNPIMAPGGNHLAQACLTITVLKNKEELGVVDKLKVAVSNSQSFQIEKNKCGNSVRQGVYDMLRVGEVGKIDQASSYWAYGRAYGLITGSNRKFKIEPLELSGKQSEILPALMDEEVLRDAFSHEILCRHRLRYGQTRDGWRADQVETVDWGRWDSDDYRENQDDAIEE